MSRIYGAPVNRKLSEADANAIREMVAGGATQRAAAKRFNVTHSTVCSIVNGRTYLEKVPKTRSDKGTIRSGDATRFGCGHPRTPTNTAKNGSSNGTCRTCAHEYNRKWRRAAFEQGLAIEPARGRPRRRPAQRPELFLESPSIALYRTEKAKAEERKRQTIIAEAKREYDAALERQRQDRNKGGRPRKAGVARPSHRSDFRKGDPLDALLEALPYYGPQVA